MARDTTELVRELAPIYGVSERTIWRWFAKIRADEKPGRPVREYLPPVPKKPRRCENCGRRIAKDAHPRRRYCKDNCRAAAHYKRSLLQ